MFKNCDGSYPDCLVMRTDKMSRCSGYIVALSGIAEACSSMEVACLISGDTCHTWPLRLS